MRLDILNFIFYITFLKGLDHIRFDYSQSLLQLIALSPQIFWKVQCKCVNWCTWQTSLTQLLCSVRWLVIFLLQIFSIYLVFDKTEGTILFVILLFSVYQYMYIFYLISLFDYSSEASATFASRLPVTYSI